jgi:hypothetical protein
VRPGLFSGCLLVCANALIALGALAVILSLYLGDEDASEPHIAWRPSAAPFAPTRKTQDRLASSDPPTLRVWRTKAERPGANLAPEAEQGASWRCGEARVRLEAFGRSRRFAFVDPRRDNSAKAGDVAFDGVREGRAFSGIAFVYSPGCGPLSYPVKGAMSADETSVALRGIEPRRDARCAIVGAVDRELVFTRSEEQKAASSGAPWTPQIE